MTPREMLANLVVGRPEREAAAEQLLSFLQKIALGTDPHIPTEDDREEIVAKVRLKVIEKSPLPVVEKTDGKCVVYLQVMVRNTWISELRRRKRHPLGNGQEDNVAAKGDPATDQAAQKEQVELHRSVIQQVFEHLRDQVQERYRAGFEQTWSQINDLVFEREDMDAILVRDEGITAASSMADKERARDRVLSAHYRLRKRLFQASYDIEKVGLLTSTQAEDCRKGLTFLLRRQNRSASDVQG